MDGEQAFWSQQFTLLELSNIHLTFCLSAVLHWEASSYGVVTQACKPGSDQLPPRASIGFWWAVCRVCSVHWYPLLTHKPSAFSQQWQCLLSSQLLGHEEAFFCSLYPGGFCWRINCVSWLWLRWELFWFPRRCFSVSVSSCCFPLHSRHWLMLFAITISLFS